jgi:Flagellar biogenesis protein
MELLNQIAGIALVFILLGAALWWLGRKKMIVFTALRGARRGDGAHLQLVERINLTPQHSIHVLRTANRGLVIAVHPAGCTLLETLPLSEIEKIPHA